MKKKIAVLLTALMVLTMGTTVFAAGSSSTTQEPVKTEAQVAAEKEAESLASGVSAGAAGIVIDGVASTVNASVTAVAPATVDSAKNAASVLVSSDATVLKVVDVKIPVSFKSVTITFAVSGVKAGMNVSALHQTSTGAWEVLPATAGDGTITATFTSLSPVAFVVNGTAATGTVSPKTGSTLPIFAVVAVICVAGAAVCAKKVKFN